MSCESSECNWQEGVSGEEVDGVEHMLKSIGWDVCLGLFEILCKTSAKRIKYTQR